MNIVIKKWIEPYVLLETSKTLFTMKDYTFNGFNKDEIKAEFLKNLSKAGGTAFGLYMKNVNKFYLFTSTENVDIQKDLLENKLNFTQNDIEYCEDTNTPINLVDLGKAEAGIFIKE